MDEVATIVSIDEDFVWLKGENQTSCGSCHSKKQCGQGLLDTFFSRQPRLLPLPIQVFKAQDIESKRVKEGDQVVLEMARSSFYNALLFGYGFPLFGLMSGAVSLELVSHSDNLALAGAGGGFLIGIFFGRLMDKLLQSKAPQITVKRIIYQ